MQEIFTLFEAQALQAHTLVATQEVKDEHDRILIPASSVCRVIGIDAWDEYSAGIAVQYTPGTAGGFPKVSGSS